MNHLMPAKDTLLHLNYFEFFFSEPAYFFYFLDVHVKWKPLSLMRAVLRWTKFLAPASATYGDKTTSECPI